MESAAKHSGSSRPLCFVLMPFGRKLDSAGQAVNFDAVYKHLIAPAVKAAGMEPIRADEELAGGIIHKPMYERLVLCDFAVADLTTANANVYYELGLRHGVRPWSTVLLYAEGTRLPFDVAPLRAIPYRLTQDGMPRDGDDAEAALVARLRAARDPVADSPVFQLIDDLRPQEIDRLKTDTFRDRFAIAADVKRRLEVARSEGVDSVRAVWSALAASCPIDDTEAAVVLDLFLSLRAVEAWDDMIRLAAEMSTPLASTVMVQEQLALALNRANRSEEAEKILISVLAKHGPSSETYGLLGRVYKDRWSAASARGEHALANGYLRKAVDAYVRGFEADWRDAYPGVNAATLMEVQTPPDARLQEILPAVRYAVKRRLAGAQPDYWDFATVLELAVLARDQEEGKKALADALASAREKWELKTTARNLSLIREARRERGEVVEWADTAEQDLLTASK